MIARVFHPDAEVTPAVERALAEAMAHFAREVDNQPALNLLPGEPWRPRRGGARQRVPVQKIRDAANAGLSHYDAAERLGLSVDHLRRQARKHGIEFKTIRQWVKAS